MRALENEFFVKKNKVSHGDAYVKDEVAHLKMKESNRDC